MPVALIILISLTSCTAGGVVKKMLTDRYGSRGDIRDLYNAACGVIAAVIFLLWGGISSLSPFTILLGIAFAAMIILQQITNMLALDCGPLSYTTVLISLSTMIPAVSGALFWNETISVSQIVGMVLLILCLILSVETGGEQKKKSARWLLFCLISFLSNGMIGVMQKIHQTSPYAGELNGFLTVAFAVMFLYSVIAFGVGCLRRRTPAQKPAEKPAEAPAKKPRWLSTAVIFLIGGACLALNHKLNLYLSGVVDAAILFPVLNGGGLLQTTLIAVIFFRERPSLKRWVGLFIGIAAVVFLCNPF